MLVRSTLACMQTDRTVYHVVSITSVALDIHPDNWIITFFFPFGNGQETKENSQVEPPARCDAISAIVTLRRTNY
jgi:hypothetical protein